MLNYINLIFGSCNFKNNFNVKILMWWLVEYKCIKVIGIILELLN